MLSYHVTVLQLMTLDCHHKRFMQVKTVFPVCKNANLFCALYQKLTIHSEPKEHSRVWDPLVQTSPEAKCFMLSHNVPTHTWRPILLILISEKTKKLPVLISSTQNWALQRQHKSLIMTFEPQNYTKQQIGNIKIIKHTLQCLLIYFSTFGSNYQMRITPVLWKISSFLSWA